MVPIVFIRSRIFSISKIDWLGCCRQHALSNLGKTASVGMKYSSSVFSKGGKVQVAGTVIADCNSAFFIQSRYWRRRSEIVPCPHISSSKPTKFAVAAKVSSDGPRRSTGIG